MRTIYALIVLSISIATIALYIRNPALSSSNIQYDHVEDRPSGSVEVLTSSAEIVPSVPKQTLEQTNKTTSITKTSLSSNKESKGLHLCTCLTPEADNPNAEIPKRLRWLHFPKTGTSFISTLWSYACSTRERYIDLEISSFQCDIFTRNKFSMYDFALMK